MIAAALVTEAQQTERAVTALIVLLLVVAGLLAVLTIWYWRHTSPKRVERRARRSRQVIGLDGHALDSTGPPTEIQPVVPGDARIETR